MQRNHQHPLVLEQAISDGNNNCAFNALILFITQETFIDKLHAKKNPNQELINFLANALRKSDTDKQIAPNWPAVRNECLRLRKTDPIALQQLLGPKFRAYSTELVNRYQQADSKGLLEALKSAFNDYVLRAEKQSVAKVPDDIFYQHPFIMNKFADLYVAVKNTNKGLDQAISAQQTVLQDWWVKSGFNLFQKDMQKTGMAGDIELAAWARFLGINLVVDRSTHFHYVHFDHGSLPANHPLTIDQVKELVIRGILDQHQVDSAGNRKLCPLSAEELEKRLSGIPPADSIILGEYAVHGDVKGKAVPPLSREGFNQLLQRNAISKTRDGKGYKFDVTTSDLYHRIDAMPFKDALLSDWKSIYKNTSTVILSNLPGSHHYNSTVYEPNNVSNKRVASKKVASVQPQPIRVSPPPVIEKPKVIVPPQVQKPAQVFDSVKKQIHVPNKELIETLKGNKPSGEKWSKLVHQYESEVPLHNTSIKKVSYSLPADDETKIDGQRVIAKEVKVATSTRDKLDEELAKRLQAEEIEIYEACQNDEEMARKMQEEENRVAHSFRFRS